MLLLLAHWKMLLKRLNQRAESYALCCNDGGKFTISLDRLVTGDADKIS